MQTIGIIESYYPSFTKSEKVVADYILRDPNGIGEYTLSELAEALHVGEATIVRFCRKMNLKGFQELKFLLALDSDSEQQEDADKHEVIRNNLIKTIQITDSMIRQAEVEQAIHMIEAASHVYFFGIGTSGLAASMGESRLFRFGKETKAITDSHRQLMQASLCDANCLIIIVSVSGETKDLIEAAQEAKEKGCHIITITNHITSTLAKLADCVLNSYGQVNVLNAGTFSSMVSQLFILDILTSAYALNNADSRKSKENIARAILKKTKDS